MAETKEQIHQRMLSNISDEYEKMKGSFPFDTTKPMAIELEDTNKKIDEVKDKLSIENLSGDELEQAVYERTGIRRKPATKASNTVTIVGQAGTQLNIGDQVSSDTLTFSITEAEVISETGQADVMVECDTAGSIGNVPVGAIKNLPVTLPGVTSVANTEAFTNGYDAETDKDLLVRYYERIQTPATSGNKYHYRNWAKDVVGVGDARVFPLWAGDNTVKVAIIDSNKQPAGQDLVDDTQDYIDPGVTGLGDGEAPIGAFCTVVAATGVNLNIAFTAAKDPSVTDLVRQANVENSINTYLKEIAFIEDTPVSYAQIGKAILNSSGILDYSDLLVNGGTANILLDEDEVAVLGGVTIA